MIRILIYFFIGFGFTLLQTSLLPRLPFLQVRPDLLLILVVYLGFNERHLRGAVLCYLLGSFFDAFAGNSPGLYGTVLVGTFLAVRLIADHLNTESSLLLLFMVFCGTLIEGLLLVFLLGTFDEAGSLLGVVLGRLPLQALVNTAIALVLLKSLLWLQRWWFPRRRIPGLQKLDTRYEP